jgi:hypothetical protein
MSGRRRVADPLLHDGIESQPVLLGPKRNTIAIAAIEQDRGVVDHVDMTPLPVEA